MPSVLNFRMFAVTEEQSAISVRHSFRGSPYFVLRMIYELMGVNDAHIGTKGARGEETGFGHADAGVRELQQVYQRDGHHP